MSPDLLIRKNRPEDLDRLHAINEANVPNVGSVSREALAPLIDLSAMTLVGEHDGAVAGFILALGPGEDYASPNYQWFEKRYAESGKSYLYVDRIAVSDGARGAGLGAALYRLLGELGPKGAPICCEVNVAPPNPGSMRFHRRLGFVEVGRGVHEPGVKEVAFLERASE